MRGSGRVGGLGVLGLRVEGFFGGPIFLAWYLEALSLCEEHVPRNVSWFRVSGSRSFGREGGGGVMVGGCALLEFRVPITSLRTLSKCTRYMDPNPTP